MSEAKDRGTAVQGRWPQDELERLDDWRRAQKKIPTRAEAVRTLCNAGLQAIQATAAA